MIIKTSYELIEVLKEFPNVDVLVNSSNYPNVEFKSWLKEPFISIVGNSCNKEEYTKHNEFVHKVSQNDWKPGDIVSRTGTDEQQIISIDHGYGSMNVVVIKSDDPGLDGHIIFEIGDEENNLIRRYSFVRRK